MKRWQVSAQVTISIYTDVEAEKEDALEIARSRRMCYLNSPQRHGDWPDECWCHSGELDGEATELNVEEEV